jgi:hypothetical protein
MNPKLSKSLLVLFALTVIGMALPHTASAQPISPKNPFRSYNIGGVNYGSQQWEKARRAKAKASPNLRGGRVFMRRR